MQILVIGPWPFGLLSQLYECLHTLSSTIMGLPAPKPLVACPRCRRTTLPLKFARNPALKAGGKQELKTCLYDCGNKPVPEIDAPEPGAEVDDDLASEDSADEELDTEEDDDSAVEGGAKLKFDVSGFGLWQSGLHLAPKKRRQVVDMAFTVAKDMSESDDRHQAATSHYVLEHACRVLEV